MTGELYAVGWRARGRPWQWVVAVYASVEAAAAAAGGYVRFDGVAGGASARPGSSLPAGRSRSSGAGCWPKGSDPRPHKGTTVEGARLASEVDVRCVVRGVEQHGDAAMTLNPRSHHW